MKSKGQAQKPSAKSKRKSQTQNPSAKAKRKSQAQKPSAKAKRKNQAQKPSAKAKASPASRLEMKLGQLKQALHLKFSTRAMGYLVMYAKGVL